MKLFLDDVRNPKNPEGWTVVRSVAEAKHALEHSDEPFTGASLDHDLGVDQTTGEENKDAPSGLDFLKWIHETGRWPLTRPVVHSANPPGARRMNDFISDFGPYGKQER